MSEEKGNLPPDWVGKKLAELRQQLEEMKNWPAGADALAADLLWPGELTGYEDLEQMLSIVIHDALQDVDISQRYPTFYRQMVRHEMFHQAFIDGLESLKSDQEITLPGSPSRDLSFLRRAHIQPNITPIRPDRWRIQWRKTTEQLQTIFKTANFVTGYRDDFWMEDDGWQTLLRSEVFLADLQLDVLLEVQQPERPNQPSSLALTITRIRYKDNWPVVQAEVQWGDYHQTITPLQEGRNLLPPFYAGQVFDESRREFLSDLRLELDVVTAKQV